MAATKRRNKDDVDPRPSPTGLSGGGVWTLREDAKVWDPSLMRLVGIVRSSNVRDRWVRTTHIRHWIDLVEGRWANPVQ
jgi:hypothetical protein